MAKMVRSLENTLQICSSCNTTKKAAGYLSSSGDEASHAQNAAPESVSTTHFRPSSNQQSPNLQLSTKHDYEAFDGDWARAEPRGALIVVEGLDRSGKTSQCNRLTGYLAGLGYSVASCRFPDRSTCIGKMISSYLSSKSELEDHSIHLLFSANRWEKRSWMANELRIGTTLVIDRYSYSGVAFSAAKGLNIEWCKVPEIGLLAPDLVVFLDISPENAAERGGYGNERYEQIDFQRKVAHSFLQLCDPSWAVVNASQPVEVIAKQIEDIALDHVIACKKGRPLLQLWRS